MPNASVYRVLATFFLAGEAAVEPIVERGARALGREWNWLRPLAQRYVAAMEGRTRPRHREVVRFLRDDRKLQRALRRHSKTIAIEHWIAGPQPMQPVAAAAEW